MEKDQLKEKIQFVIDHNELTADATTTEKNTLIDEIVNAVDELQSSPSGDEHDD